MFALIANWFKEPPIKETIKDKTLIDKMYKHWSFRIFYSTYLTYIIIHFCRKNIAIALPYISKDLGFTNTELGVIGATLYVTYGVGKFVNGIIADKTNVRTFLPTALVLSAFANVCFVLSATFITPNKVSFFGLPPASILLWILTFFWGANGWFQSMIFPPIAKALSYWIPKSKRATMWSIWTTSHQFGVFSTIIISGFLIDKFGWKAAFYIPAILVTITAFWMYDRLRDKPQTLGIPDVESIMDKQDVKIEIQEDDKKNYIEIFKTNILFNKTLWLLSFAYAFIYLIRFGTEDWLVKYLVEDKGNTLILASQKLGTLAVAGALGAISAGFISDKIFKGNRISINIIFTFCLCLSILAFNFNLAENQFLDFAFAAMIGYFTSGPLLLLGGVCALEVTSKKVSSAALGFTGIFGYIGAVLSSSGTGYMIDKYGWQGASYFWFGSAVICLTICIILAILQIFKTKESNL